MINLVEQFGRKGLITIYGMTLCALLGAFKVDVAIVTCVAGLVTVFCGADTVITRGYAKAAEAESQRGVAEANKETVQTAVKAARQQSSAPTEM